MMLTPNGRYFVAFRSGGMLATLAACCLGLGLALALGTDSRSLFRPDDGANPEWQRSRDLEAQRVAILYRVNSKCSLAVEVLEGRLGLLEAAGRFRALDRQCPAYVSDPRQAHLVETEAERYCRSVIAVVRMMPHHRPDTQAGVTGRLEAELRRHLERGDLRLPEEPDDKDKKTDKDIRKAKSPLGKLEGWNRPTVLLGSAGLLLAGQWQNIGGAG
jgi:hypothetical protein